MLLLAPGLFSFDERLVGPLLAHHPKEERQNRGRDLDPGRLRSSRDGIFFFIALTATFSPRGKARWPLRCGFRVRSEPDASERGPGPFTIADKGTRSLLRPLVIVGLRRHLHRRRRWGVPASV